MSLQGDIYSKIAGVSHNNADGESRQEIIRKYVRPGVLLGLIPEPNNPYSDTAVGIWINTVAGIKQLGYIRDTTLDDQLFEYLQRKGKLTCSVSEVTGGGDKTLGVNILIRILQDHPQPQPSASAVKAPATQSKDPLINVATRTWNKGRTGQITVISVAMGVLLFCFCCIVYSASQPRRPSTPTVAPAPVQPTAALIVATQTQAVLPTQTFIPIPTHTVVPLFTEDSYWQEFISRYSSYQTAFLNTNDLQQKLKADPNLLLSEDWRLRMGVSLGILDVAATNLESIPNVPPKYLQLDLLMKDMCSQTHLFVKNYATGIDNMDSTLIEAANLNLQNITTLLNSAIAEVDRLKSQ